MPAATALVLNEALIETPVSREEAFARVLRHSAFRGALVRGAVPVWMPRLLPAGEIEARRVGFAQAAHGVAREGRRQTPLGAFDQAGPRLARGDERGVCRLVGVAAAGLGGGYWAGGRAADAGRLLTTCQGGEVRTDQDTGRRYCVMAVWLDPPLAPATPR